MKAMKLLLLLIPVLMFSKEPKKADKPEDPITDRQRAELAFAQGKLTAAKGPYDQAMFEFQPIYMAVQEACHKVGMQFNPRADSVDAMICVPVQSQPLPSDPHKSITPPNDSSKEFQRLKDEADKKKKESEDKKEAEKKQ